jgi:tetratricopeptide (TPR) repeat protein
MSSHKSLSSGRKNSAFSKKSLRPSVFQQPVLKEGYLEKQSSGTVKKWQSRYFEISGHYLNYYDKKEARSEQAVKGAFDLNHIREVNAAATSITIEVNDGSTVNLRGASEEVARLWVAEIKQVVGDLKATTSDLLSLLLAVVVEGFPQPELDSDVPEINGQYSAMQDAGGKNKMVNGRHVWKKDENCYIYYAQQQMEDDQRWHWWISNEEDMEAGKPTGYAKVASEAVEPQDISDTWEKQSADGSWLDADGSRIWSTEFQFAGNHFTRGITLQGFIMLLSIIGWDHYNIAERKKHKSLSWLQDPEKNGYDLCKIVIPAYMAKIGLEHLSLVEAIESGQVAELVCLKDAVGAADAFLSHVQKLSVRVLLASLKDGEQKYEAELLEDTAAVAALRRKALENFLKERDPDDDQAGPLIAHFQYNWKDIENWLQQNRGSAPTLASITARKPGPPKYFIDYAGIRQCLSNEFTIERCVDAIATIGTTLVELDADFAGETALLRRIFCVLESFATIKAKGKLLVCGPALQDAKQTLKLAALAANRETCKDIIDSETKAKCRWAEEEAKIKAYMEGSVGFARTDRVVLAAIVASCVRSAEKVFDAQPDCGMAVLHAVGCMLEEAGDYQAAQVQLEAALGKGEAAFGEGAFETAETVYMLGKCHGLTDGEGMVWYERSLRMSEAQYGKEHAATARSLVGIGAIYVTLGIQQYKDEATTTTGLECLRLAIARIEAADCPADHADAHADALYEISTMHCYKEQWRECLEWSERSVRMRASKHGPDHALAANALSRMASMHGELGDRAKGMALQLRVHGILVNARGRLSREAGIECANIAADHHNVGQYSEAVVWFKQALEAMEYTTGPADSITERCRELLKGAIDGMDPADAKTQEYRRFVEESKERARA